MKIISIISAAIIAMSISACAQNKSNKIENTESMNKKVLVAYFSATGTTARVAKTIAELVQATLYEIRPQQEYTVEDLDWNDKQSRSSVEMNDASARPALVGDVDNIGQYDVVFLGYPIWWDLAPRPVYTFIESNNLKDKTVIPFATSGGSPISGSIKDLKSKYPQINWGNGRLLNGSNKNTVGKWLKQMNVQ